ncbi:MAG: ABC transporter permease [Gemmatimonadota bacterium]
MSAAREWRVELSTRAAERVRGLEPPYRDVLRRSLDQLTEGLPSDAREGTEADGWTWEPRPGLLIRLLVHAERRVILVFAVEAEAARSSSDSPSRWSGLRWPTGLLMDVRGALRSLRRAPSFTIGVVLTLALGIGGASTVFGLVHTVFRGSLPFEDGDRVVRILSRSVATDGGDRLFNVTPRDFVLVRDGHRSFTGVVAQSGRSISLLGEGPAQRASAIGVSSGWSDLLGVQPILGRTFTPEEEALGRDAGVALLSHALWQQRFGGDPSAVGSDLLFDGGSARVVGIMPPRFSYPYDADLWTPWRPDPADWTTSSLNIVARLRPGADVPSAQLDVDALYADLRAESAGTAPNEGFGVRTSREDFIRTQAASLQSLAIAVFFLLLLVCVNVANLLLARGAARRQEIAVRAALGAGRARQIRAVVLESVLVFALGGVAGLALVPTLGTASSVLIPDVLRTQLDLSVRVGPALLGFTAAIVLVGGALAGWLGARTGRGSDLNGLLRSGGRGSTASSGRMRNALIVSELALSLVLLIGAGVLADHFRRLQTRDLGFEPVGVVTAQLPLQHERYDDPHARVRLYEEVRDALGRSGRVESVALTSVNPLCCGDWGARIRVEGLERPADAPPITIHHRYVSREYFEAMELPIVAGRAFDATDAIDTPLSVIIDEDLAARFWPDGDAVGRRISMDRDPVQWRTIVGVAARAHAEGDPRESWYLPFEQQPLGGSNEIVHLMIRGEGVDETLVRGTVADVDPALAVFGVSTMEEHRDERLAQDRIGAVVGLVFAGVGLLLAAVGLYGLLAYHVELRRRELGMRVALGATRVEISTWMLGQTGRLLAAGLGIGLVLAYGATQVVVSLVAGARPAPAGVVLALCGVLALTALAAMTIPTVRALGTDPATVLRND